MPLEVLLPSAVEILPPKHPPVNPPPPPFKIPRAEWPRVVQHVAKGESLRQVARSYRVSYEAIRRILATMRRSQAHVNEVPSEKESRLKQGKSVLPLEQKRSSSPTDEVDSGARRSLYLLYDNADSRHQTVSPSASAKGGQPPPFD